MSSPTSPTPRHTLWRAFDYLAPHKAAFGALQAAVLAAAAASVALPYLLGRVISAFASQAATPQAAHSAGSTALLLFGAAAAVNVLATFYEVQISSRLELTVIFSIRRSVFEHVLNADFSRLDRARSGHLTSVLQSDVIAIQEFFENTAGAIGDIATLLGIAVALIVLDARLGILSLCTLPILVLARTVWGPRARQAFLTARDAAADLNGALAEGIGGVQTVQGATRERRNLVAFEAMSASALTAQARASWLSKAVTPAIDILTGLAIGLVIYIGGGDVLGGRLDVGGLIAFIWYLQRFFDPVRNLSTQHTIIQRAVTAAVRIFEVLDWPVHASRLPGPAVRTVAPMIEFRNVSFGYVPGQPVLQNVSFQARRGEVIALVGPTGAGKSSIMSLLRGFYPADSGEVLIGGVDVRAIDPPVLAETIGLVFQDPFLFSGTIEENIRYRCATACAADVVAAARATGAHDFILRLPEGYRTPVGQRGRNLSLGQRQLIAVARTLLANPKILVLDEATANVDSFTEQVLQRELRTLLAGRTCLMIAHRLATVRDADRIIVLQNGRIAEEGTHQTLLGHRGLYWRLCRSGRADFDEPERTQDEVSRT